MIRAENRVLTDLRLEAGVEIEVGDNVMQHPTTGLVRPAEDLPGGYVVVGQSEDNASTVGAAAGSARINAIQGELGSDQDVGSPVQWPRNVNTPIYATGRRSVGETSVNKVFAGRAIEVNASTVLHIVETTGQP